MQTTRDTAIIAAPTPFAIGAQFQIVRGPVPANWPKANSIKYIGFPAKVNIIRYGIKKAPPPQSFKLIIELKMHCKVYPQKRCLTILVGQVWKSK